MVLQGSESDFRGVIYTPSPTESREDGPVLRSAIGGKAFNLLHLSDEGGNVPRWFVVTTDLFQRVLARGGVGSDDFAACRRYLRESVFPDEVAEEIRDRISRHAPTLFAVRSSAAAEDSAEHSFAGQFETALNVRGEDVPEAIRQVWMSACSDRVEAYLRMRSLPLRVPSIAVIVQRMIPADVSGVAFGCDPVSGDRSTVVISSLYGLGEGLVSGELDADTFRVSLGRDGSVPEVGGIASTIAEKRLRYVLNPEALSGGREEEVPDSLRRAPSLEESSIREIARIVVDLDHRFGGPQDVEWSIADGELYLLQTRPVTTVAPNIAHRIGKEESTRYVWDNSNIIESYSGVTTPLTFSFIDTVYSEVYRELTRILGVSERTIERNRPVFSMLGLIRGRVYYNLLNWYRVLALLPGYQVNARFMEGMMGVTEPLEEKPEIVTPRGPQLPRLLWSVWRLVRNLIALPKEIARFHAHVDRVLGPYENRDLGSMSESELVGLYRTLERELLLQWRTPILNDFYTMIFHGLLRKLIPLESGENVRTVENDLLVGEGGIISTEPMRLLQRIGVAIREDPELTATFIDDPHRGFEEARAIPTIAAMIDEYLLRFGNRYAAELCLETITPAHRPELLAGTLKGYVVRHDAIPEGGSERTREVRRVAEMWVITSERISPIRRWLFRRVLRATRTRIRNRENLRFERTRVFAVVRAIALALGAHLKRRDVIQDERDVFYLTIDELFSLGTGEIVGSPDPDTLARPAEVIAARKLEFGQYADEPPPPDRFATDGHPTDPGFTIVHEVAGEREEVDDRSTLRGLPCSPGRVRGPVRIVRDPSKPGDLAGHILVAERTDPGWGPLFPLATGLLVERGSLLSHSAIVAREMGIPAIVAIPGLLERLSDGELIEFDGQTGLIRRVPSQTPPAEDR